jgi:hypothetical protein
MSAIDTLLESDEAVKALFAGQQPDGGFGYHPYTKFGGAHWRLVSLVELAVPPASRVRSQPSTRC